jgi:hypothetical protein
MRLSHVLALFQILIRIFSKDVGLMLALEEAFLAALVLEFFELLFPPINVEIVDYFIEFVLGLQVVSYRVHTILHVPESGCVLIV